MRLLCTGDLHLGRRSSRIPASSTTRSNAALSAADAWSRIVELAIQQSVDGVLLSGDVVDEENRFFEAIGPLERGLRALQAAQIPVVAVAGNHDYDVLPALQRTLPDGALRLLGSHGEWERTTIVSRTGERVHVDGWSFTARHEHSDPLALYTPAAADGTPVIGLLHGDLDAPASAYAPITRDGLRAHAVHCWVLGHVHSGGRRERDGEAPVLYPGSPQPLDPGEPGVHGVYLVTVAPNHAVRTVLHPIATVQYDTVTIDLSDCTRLDEARSAAAEAVRDALSTMHEQNPQLCHAAFRLHLAGRSPLHGQLDALAAELLALQDVGDLTGDAFAGRCSVNVTHVALHTAAAYDLAGLANRRDAVGMLARLLIAVHEQRTDAIDPGLWRTVQSVVPEVRGARAFRGTPAADGITDTALQAMIATQATRLLDALLAQQEASA